MTVFTIAKLGIIFHHHIMPVFPLETDMEGLSLFYECFLILNWHNYANQY